ncbi:hypothetical protein FRC12_017213 [Ceratobasidium sp. 428]|nr:hypothetical protein FRC12_017213 [Ceratobasidium sp. 428]
MFTFDVTVLSAERARSNSTKLLIYNLVRTPVLEELSLGEPQPDVSSCRSLNPAYSLEFPTLMGDLFFGPNAIVVDPGCVSEEFSSKRSKVCHNPSYVTLCVEVQLARGYEDINSIVFPDVQRVRNHFDKISAHTTQSIPCDQWGEATTRWIGRLDDFDSQANMNGSRFVMLLERTPREPQLYHFVADFNPLVVKGHENRELEKCRLRAVDPDDYTFRRVFGRRSSNTVSRSKGR